MINSIIIQHLKHNKRLVMPGFGAFIKKDDTGEIIFVEFLKKDDGVLSSLLQESYSLNQSDAAQIINNYVVETKKQILTRGRFILDGLGVMYIDANSIYNFEYDPSVKVEVVEIPNGVKSAETVVQEVKPTEPQPVKPTELPQSPQSQIARQMAEPQPRKEEQTATKQPKPEKQQIEFDTEVDHKAIDVSGLRYRKPIKPVVIGQNKKKTDTIMLIAIIAAAIAIIAMIYGMFFSHNNDLTLNKGTEPKTEQTTPPTKE